MYLLRFFCFLVLGLIAVELGWSASSETLKGELNIIRFIKDAEISGEDSGIVLNGNRKLIVGESGELWLELNEGKHFLEIHKKEGGSSDDKSFSIPFEIIRGEVTQVVLNISEDSIKTSKNMPKSFDRKESLLGPLFSRTGLVFDDAGKRLANVRVLLKGTSHYALTDKKGFFRINLPLGKSELVLFHKSYRTKSLPLKALKGAPKKLDLGRVELETAGIELQDFIVLSPSKKGSFGALIEFRRKSSNVSDVISAEQMSRSGDSDAASSLSRVTGLTLIDGKYIYVRGLGERYSSVLLNDVNVPSPDPTRKVVPLDIFPSGILENVVVQKSYTPDLPGEFGGGTIKLNSKTIPKKFMAKVSIGKSFDESGEILSYEGGKNDWTGYDDGSRELPGSFSGREIVEDQGVGGLSNEEIKKLSKDMPRNYKTSKSSRDLPPSLSLYVGDRYKFNQSHFGYFFSTMYSSSEGVREKEKYSYALVSNDSDKLSQQESSSHRTSQFNVKLGTMLSLGLKVHNVGEFSLTSSLLRKSTDKVDISNKQNSDDKYENTLLEWTERQLTSHILKTNHKFGTQDSSSLNFRYAYNEATRYQPGQKQYKYNFIDDERVLDSDGDANSILFSDLKDTAQDAMVKFETPLFEKREHRVKLAVGGQATLKRRRSDARRFKYDLGASSGLADSNESTSFEEVCSDERIEAGDCKITENTKANDNYNASQSIYAQFVNVEYSYGSKFSFNMGMRNENSYQKVSTYALNSADSNEVSAELAMNDQLPVYGIKYNINKDMLIRLAYSETVSRPDFKELSTSPYYDDERGETVQGNPELNGTVIENIDLRYEWYFNKLEYFSLGGFYKKFNNPIESVYGVFIEGELKPADGDKATFANVESAENYGIEIEWNKRLPFLKRLSLGGNLAYIESKVDIGDKNAVVLTSTRRAMQGQSPYTVNCFLDYNNKDSGMNATLLYNVFGKRISSVGVRGEPDIYEQPAQYVDFVFSQKFASNSSVKLKLKNLLDPEIVKKQGSEIKEKFKKGRSVSLGFTQRF